MSPDVAAAIRARLLEEAKNKREEFERTLARFAAERLLYRLGASAARNRCLLKGASLLAGRSPLHKATGSSRAPYRRARCRHHRSERRSVVHDNLLLNYDKSVLNLDRSVGTIRLARSIETHADRET